MFPVFHHRRAFMEVAIVHARSVTGQGTRQDHFGMMGSVIWAEPISVEERVRFWGQLDARFAALRKRWPGRFTKAEETKLRGMIAKRIPMPPIAPKGTARMAKQGAASSAEARNA